MTKPTLLIVDGNSFMHRAYNGMPSFVNKKGFPTQILAGVCNMINSEIKKQKPEKIVVAFDHKGKTFRHELFKDYKGTRPSLNDDFRKQIQPLKDILHAWGLPIMSIEGVEADDSMSTLAVKGKEAGYSVIMLTSDKDMCQIVQDDIGILDTKDPKNTVMYQDGVKVKMGVTPEQIITLLALEGDKVDNIPGVEGVGSKTAIKWIEEYQTVDNLINHKDEIKGKVGERFRAAIEDGTFELCLKLVTIDTNVDLGKDIEDFVGVQNDEELLSLLNEYELFNFKKALGLIDESADNASMDVVLSEDEINQFITDDMSKSEILFVENFEIKNKDYLMISTPEKDSAYALKVEDHLNVLSTIVEDKNKMIVGINTKSVLNVLYKHIKSNNVFKMPINDMRVYDYVQGNERSKEASLENLNNDYCQFNFTPLREEFKLNGKSPKWDKMSEKQICEVVSESVKITKHIFDNKLSEYDKESEMLDNKMISILSMMECQGVHISKDILTKSGNEFSLEIEELEADIFEIAKENFKINSPKDVARILFDKLELPSKKKSTGEDVLVKAIDELDKHDIDDNKKEDLRSIVQNILRHRSLTKLVSTYVTGLISRLDGDRVHTTYNLTTTKTGRLSSVDPNLQNIPMKSEDGKKIRKAFEASDGYKIVAIDYSQIELRVLAHLANVEGFINAFNNGDDIHAQTASDIFGISIEDVTDAQRRIAKAINFGLIYGMGEKRLAEDLNIERKEAKLYYKGFFTSYEEIKPYFEDELEKAKDNLFIKTLFGRVISAKDLSSPHSMIRSHAEKSAKNARIQGTAAEIIKKAMVNIFEYLIESNVDARMIMQVHDELVFEVKEDIAESFTKTISDIMENAVSLKVPLVVEAKIADNWYDAH